MFKYQVHFLTVTGWQGTGTYYALDVAETVAHGIGALDTAQATVISQIWIPRTEV